MPQINANCIVNLEGFCSPNNRAFARAILFSEKNQCWESKDLQSARQPASGLQLVLVADFPQQAVYFPWRAKEHLQREDSIKGDGEEARCTCVIRLLRICTEL